MVGRDHSLLAVASAAPWEWREISRVRGAKRVRYVTELTGEGAKPCEEIPVHQIDELRFAFWGDLKSRRPFNVVIGCHR